MVLSIGKSLYLQVYEAVSEKIKRGEYKPGELIPSQAELMAEYKASITTIRKALDQLCSDNLILKHQGKGNYVKQPTPEAKTKNIGFIVYNINHLFYSCILMGVEQFTEKAGYNVILSNSLGSQENELSILMRLYESKKVDGFLICPVEEAQHSKSLKYLTEKNIPHVIFPQVDTSGLNSDYVICDDFEGSVNGVSHLIESGYRRIAYLDIKSARSINLKNRLGGYKKALELKGIKFDKSLCINVDDVDEESGSAAADKLLEMKPRPDAVYAMGDRLGIGIIRRLKQRGIMPGRDIGVLGFDNLMYTDIPEISLTTLDQPKEKIGSTAADILIQRISGNVPDKNQIVIKPELIIRGSTCKTPKQEKGK